MYSKAKNFTHGLNYLVQNRKKKKKKKHKMDRFPESQINSC